MISYWEMFQRNYGIFSKEEQSRIKNAHILIIGCGGIGGLVAVILARSGVEQFTLIDFDTYEPSNINRQIGCFTHTLGQHKAQIIADQLVSINPSIKATVYDRKLTFAEIGECIKTVDIVFPAADDMAFSIFVFKEARRAKKPALLVVPAGTWANVSMIMPQSPPVEKIHGVPQLNSYEALYDVFHSEKGKFGAMQYLTHGHWNIDHFHSFVFENAPIAQICPTVWICSSIGALEVLKTLTGKMKPVVSPNYWEITSKKIRVARIGDFSLHTGQLLMKRLMWPLLQTRVGPLLETYIRTVWNCFYRYICYRQKVKLAISKKE
ncbi:MAG: ThiF family adenylyltransferase [Desulfobacterales bacterium]|nr:ThiF family adenylyltransferase [Desulfobacterales bacterium]